MRKALLCAFSYTRFPRHSFIEQFIKADIKRMVSLYTVVFGVEDIIVITDMDIHSKNYEVITLTTYDDFILNVQDFFKSLRSQDIGFFYYSGHGEKIKRAIYGTDGVALCIPAGRQIKSFHDKTLIKMISKLRNDNMILLTFDCCYAGNILKLKYINDKESTNYIKVKPKVLSLSSSDRLQVSRFSLSGSLFTHYFQRCALEFSRSSPVYSCVNRHIIERDQNMTVSSSDRNLGLTSFMRGEQS